MIFNGENFRFSTDVWVNNRFARRDTIRYFRNLFVNFFRSAIFVSSGQFSRENKTEKKKIAKNRIISRRANQTSVENRKFSQEKSYDDNRFFVFATFVFVQVELLREANENKNIRFVQGGSSEMIIIRSETVITKRACDSKKKAV